jgi:hypothetical protein
LPTREESTDSSVAVLPQLVLCLAVYAGISTLAPILLDFDELVPLVPMFAGIALAGAPPPPSTHPNRHHSSTVVHVDVLTGHGGCGGHWLGSPGAPKLAGLQRAPAHSRRSWSSRTRQGLPRHIRSRARLLGAPAELAPVSTYIC